MYDEEAGVDIRGRFLIDPDFVIRVDGSDDPRSWSKCAGIDSAGEGLPARAGNWRGHSCRLAAGKATLKPGPELAGKVWKVWKPEQAF